MEQNSGTQVITRRTKTQILELLRAYDKNHGLTVKAFCQRHKVSEGAFYTARKRFRSTGISPQQRSGFIAIAQPASKEPTGTLFAEVNGIKLYQAVPADYLKALVV